MVYLGGRTRRGPVEIRSADVVDTYRNAVRRRRRKQPVDECVGMYVTYDNIVCIVCLLFFLQRECNVVEGSVYRRRE